MILISGDVHGERNYEHIDKNHKINNLTEKDYLIICGDLGIGFKENFLEKLKQKKYTILFLDGNHENFPYLNSLKVEKWHNGKVHKIADNIYHLMRGQVYEIENKTFFTFGGAKSIYNKNQIKDLNWFPELEEGTEEEQKIGLQNLANHNFSVDYILTHTCSSTYLQILSGYLTMFLEESNTSIYLEQIETMVNYKKWFFGHFHEDFKIDSKTTLVFENVIKL